jgi:hypothetical protein
MRARIFFLAMAAVCVTAGAAVQACGGDATVAEPVDAGKDVATEKAPPAPEPDTGAPDTGPGCDTTADFTAKIPDASIADGASTSGICIGCAKANCKSDLDKCTQLCECQKAAGGALDCFFQKGSITACAGPLVGVSAQTRDIGISLFGCISTKCEAECAVNQLVPDAGDAATD